MPATAPVTAKTTVIQTAHPRHPPTGSADQTLGSRTSTNSPHKTSVLRSRVALCDPGISSSLTTANQSSSREKITSSRKLE